jgi:hypothetical protein
MGGIVINLDVDVLTRLLQSALELLVLGRNPLVLCAETPRSAAWTRPIAAGSVPSARG